MLTDSFYREIAVALRARSAFEIAVGSGEAAWDDRVPRPSRPVEALTSETARKPVDVDGMKFLDRAGQGVGDASSRLEFSVVFDASEATGTLRECGLFLGGGPEGEGGGTLLSYFRHPRVDKTEGMVLSRAIRIDLTPAIMAPSTRERDGPGRWLELPEHWLTDLPVDTVDGVGAVYSAVLTAAGVATLGALAEVEPEALGGLLPSMTAVELHAKARLAIRSAGRVRLPSGMQDRTLRDVILAPAHELVAETGVPSEAIQRLREQMFVLQVALSDRFLRRTRIGELADVD